MKTYIIDNKGHPHEGESLEGVDLAACKLVWVDLQDPSLEERRSLRDFFDLHPLMVEVPLEAETLPRVLEFDGHVLVIWNVIRDEPATEKLETTSLYMVLGDNFLITAHIPDLPEIDNIFDRLRKEPAPRRDHPAFFLYSIMNVTVEEWFPLVEKLKEDIDSYMEMILSDNKSSDISAVMALKHQNMAARRTISALRDVVLRLARRDLPVIPDDMGVYLMDVYDHLTRVYLEVDNNSELISSSVDIHLSTVSNRLNVTMKRLTAVATFFMPATFLAGVYGMNFKHFPEIYWYWGYLFFWIAIIVITVGMFIIARRQDWF